MYGPIKIFIQRLIKHILTFTAGAHHTGFEAWAALGLTAIRSRCVYTLLVVMTHMGSLCAFVDICMTTKSNYNIIYL